MRNHWGTYKGSLIRWDVTFSPAFWDRTNDLAVFAAAVHRAGSELAIYMHPTPNVTTEGNLFPTSGGKARVAVRTSSGIVERQSDDLGSLLLELQPDVGRIPHGAPVTVWGPLSSDRSGPVYVSIKLESDIWFPRVVGILEQIDDEEEVDWFDNADLAVIHTPRLNSFLEQVRAEAERLGADWSHDCSRVARYQEMVSASGIVLD